MKPFIARFMPGGIGGQIAVLVVASLLLANIVGAAIFLVLRPGFDPGPPGGPPGGPGGAFARAGVLLQVLAAEPSSQRQAMLQSLAMALPGIRVIPLAPGAAAPASTPAAGDPLLGRFAGEIGDDIQLRLVNRAGPDMPMRFTATLADGASFVVEMAMQPPPPPPARVTGLLVASLAAAILTIVVLSLWAVRGLIAPLRRFAAAADSFGSGNGEIALDETGPTEIRQAAGALNRMRARIGRLIDERTRMLAAVSHDLRTPLTRLRLRAESLTSPDLRQPMLRDLHMMDTMIGSALSFLRDRDAPEPIETVDLATVLQTICDEFAAVGHAVFYEGPDHMLARCRPVAFSRAISNLVDNGVKYGSSTIIGLEMRKDGTAVISIGDDGPGIPPAELDQVFAPFYRSDQARRVEGNRGFGLGLSIARTIVESHGGTLSLANREPHGLVAAIALPPASAGIVTV